MNPEENTPVSSVVSSSGQASVAPIKIGKFKASRMIVSESWKVLKQDKELAWFPVFSAIASIVALIVMGVLFFFFVMGSNIHAFESTDKNTMDVLGYAIMLVYYLVMFFITNYFLAGIYTIVHGRFSGQNLSLNDGINNANKNLGKIFLWSLISATVGVLLQIIADKSKIVGKIIVSLLGAAWAILTYFSLPSLIIGQKSVTDSFKESASVIRKTWGETIIVNFGVGLFFGLIIFLAIIISIGIVVIAPTKLVFILVVTLFVIFLIAITIISSTLSSIFKLALYEFAITGNVPQGFTPDLVRGAVRAVK